KHTCVIESPINTLVSDFGLSRSVNDVTTMTACGTPCWAAPEVLRNSHYSFEADVFSFAICFWEMVTLKYPYHGRPPYQVVIAVTTKVFIITIFTIIMNKNDNG